MCAHRTRLHLPFVTTTEAKSMDEISRRSLRCKFGDAPCRGVCCAVRCHLSGLSIGMTPSSNSRSRRFLATGIPATSTFSRCGNLYAWSRSVTPTYRPGSPRPRGTLRHPEFQCVLSMGRPWSLLSVRLAFWKAMNEGLPTSVAARAAGVSRATAYRWLGEDWQMLPSPLQNFAVTRAGSLSLREREEIGFQLARGQGVRQIAAVIGRAPSTISREVARNRVDDRCVPSFAQEQTRARARRP